MLRKEYWHHCSAMKRSLFSFFILLTNSLVGLGASAQSSWHLVHASTVPISAPVPNGMVCSGYDDSVCVDVSRFYKFNQRWNFTLIGQFDNEWGIRLSLTTGASSKKMVVEPLIVFGMIRSKPLTHNQTLTAEVYSSIGGESSHIPCWDDYGREYFCGSLTAWSDYPNKRLLYQEYGVKLHYRFN